MRPLAKEPGRPRTTIQVQDLRHIGKFAVSSSTQRDEAGQFGACVAIRSGQGSMTHQRVIRFDRRFASHDLAISYAREQAGAWISEHQGHTPALARE